MSRLDSYFPWIRRVWFILCWFYEIICDQVNPLYAHMFVPPSLWPGWDWAKMNAVHSSRSSPWHLSWVFSAYNIHAEDDDYEDYEDYEDYDYDDDNEF